MNTEEEEKTSRKFSYHVLRKICRFQFSLHSIQNTSACVPALLHRVFASRFTLFLNFSFLVSNYFRYFLIRVFNLHLERWGTVPKSCRAVGARILKLLCGPLRGELHEHFDTSVGLHPNSWSKIIWVKFQLRKVCKLKLTLVPCRYIVRRGGGGSMSLLLSWDLLLHNNPRVGPAHHDGDRLFDVFGSSLEH